MGAQKTAEHVLHPVNSQSSIGNALAIKAQRMAELLEIEAAARRADTVTDLAINLVNEPANLTGFAQAFCFRRKKNDGYRIEAVTAQSTINKHAPFIQMMEECVSRIAREHNSEEEFPFTLTDIETNWKDEQNSYPFPHCYWLPLYGTGSNEAKNQLGGYLVTRANPWHDADLVILNRITETYGHAWHTIELNEKSQPEKIQRKKKILAAGIALFALAMLIPVPYTVLAPAQIVAEDPFIISAPIDGVIKEVHINPNEAVEEGQILFSFVDINLRNNAKIAENELAVSNARKNNVAREALINDQERRGIALATAEQNLAQTRKSYADELLTNINVKTPKAGIALFRSRNDLNGLPVSTGERIIEIANPNQIEIQFEVSANDGLTLKQGQPVSVFLDTNPLKAIRGEISRASYTPETGENGTLIYRGFAKITNKDGKLPRIGMRGSAKIKAKTTNLGYWLFRKPIVILRRNLGI